YEYAPLPYTLRSSSVICARSDGRNTRSTTSSPDCSTMNGPLLQRRSARYSSSSLNCTCPIPIRSPDEITVGSRTGSPFSSVPLLLLRSSSHHCPPRRVTSACSWLAKLSSSTIVFV